FYFGERKRTTNQQLATARRSTMSVALII
ncbi:hypothetical protein ABIE61_003572, partial [Marinobacterium sp. MBR-111]